MKPEERAKIEEAKKENVKIGNLNAMLKSAREAQAAGNPEEAVRIMTEATTMDPTRDILWAQLADGYLASAKKNKNSQQYEDAVAAYQKAIGRVTEKTPKNVVALYNNGLGQCYTRLGKLDEAIKAYQAAVDNDPANAAMFDFNMGAAYLGAGKKDEATAAFTKALQADPNYAEAYYQRAINLSADIKVDDKTGAMIVPPQVTTDLNKYLELKPEGPNAEGAKALLASFGTKVETSYGPQRKTSAPKKK
jgi:tetratricopeptide (TPR) repeat protein